VKQQEVLLNVLEQCGVRRNTALAATLFESLNSSQRGTFVAVTHALLNTVLMDRTSGKKLGRAFTIVRATLDIRGENASPPSDRQFQMIVEVIPGAERKLEKAADFDKGENGIFHKGYPTSFRQSRKIGLPGQEAGLHISFTPDGRRAEIHIDYRFGLLHLMSANSDPRANGNRQRHAARWLQTEAAD
jgi:hypothetical protein